ncbi:MAG TPA: iron-containing alcohol dehydrogenase [Pyrinomonadaceae bacterium]|jgi:alcohol dehydrogenase|nr:iron-containing alcohol dehydrogenase [Pyrinomonadaceae bacterium]
MQGFDFQPRTRVIFGTGSLSRLGEEARSLGFRRALLVADRGLVEAGHVERASKVLEAAGVAVFPFRDFDVNPDAAMVERGRAFAAPLDVDSIVALGGGSSLDCAKGINFLLTNGGRMQDFVGYGRARRPLLPSIGVPTTSGTGSEAQSYALISDERTHAKMVCGDASAAFRVALLDPELTLSAPRRVTAAAGFDAVAHAVETYVSTRRNPLSEIFSREAWRLLEGSYERALAHPEDVEARASMLLGAHLAGAAIENSMLGAAHACANPLTARYGAEHGAALAMLLPSVVRWNASEVGARYAELSGRNSSGVEALARRVEELAEAGGLRRSLSESGVLREDLPALAEDAAGQWTGRFNPRAFDAAGALEVYGWAY